jgi:uncharacterized protein (TIGR00369 family)
MSEVGSEARPTRREIMREFVPASPLVRHLGIRLKELTLDRAELELPFHERLATVGDTIHGGAIASLIDTAGMAATWSDEERPETMAGSTVSMNVDFIAAARGKDLLATAVTVKRGRSLCFNDVTVTEPDGRVIAKGSVVQRFG